MRGREGQSDVVGRESQRESYEREIEREDRERESVFFFHTERD